MTILPNVIYRVNTILSKILITSSQIEKKKNPKSHYYRSTKDTGYTMWPWAESTVLDYYARSKTISTELILCSMRDVD